jgi:lipoprotein-anchoring transpeptidase ErfK/SrfK
MRLRFLLALLLSLHPPLFIHSARSAQRVLLASSHKGDAVQPISQLATPRNGDTAVPRATPAAPRNSEAAPTAPRVPPATAPSAIAPAADYSSIVVSVAEQKLYLFDSDGRKLTSYRVSTSKFGLGDSRSSYATPLGQFAIASKIGHGVEPGTVFHHCRPTGEICRPNAPGRDPIVTRILPLRGLEKENAQALSRGIFIHGTADERHIGQPVSYGCIRMKSRDVLELFEQVQAGTRVEITTGRVSGLFGNITHNVPARGSQ